MVDYSTDLKACPFNVPVMGITITGIYVIGQRRNDDFASYDEAKRSGGKTLVVYKLDPITGKMIGTVNIVKWAEFKGEFDKPKKPRSITSNDKTDDQYERMRVLSKRFGVNEGVAYRWIKKGKVKSHIFMNKRMVKVSQFADLAKKYHAKMDAIKSENSVAWENHIRKISHLKNVKATLPQTTTLAPVKVKKPRVKKPKVVEPKKRWWQFWK